MAYVDKWDPEQTNNSHHGKSAKDNFCVSLEKQEVPPFYPPALPLNLANAIRVQS